MTRTSSRSNFKQLLSSLLLLSFVASTLTLFPLPAQAAGEITFRSSATSNSETITAPSDIEAGDILVLLDRAEGGSTVVLSGFITLSNLAPVISRRQILSYKLADGSEASATLTGMSGVLVSKVLLVFAAGASSLTPSTFDQENTNGNPSAQSATASGAAAPLVVLAGYGSNDGTSISARAFTPAKDGEIDGSVSDNYGWLAWKLYNSSPADVSIDMNDYGNDNALQSGYIEATIPPDAPTDLTTTSTTGAVNLSWTAPATSGSSDLETYGIWRATSPFTATTSATLIASIATTSTSYSDTSVALRANYYYAVTATNDSATSSLSNQRSSNANSGRIIRLGGLRLR